MVVGSSPVAVTYTSLWFDVLITILVLCNKADINLREKKSLNLKYRAAIKNNTQCLRKDCSNNIHRYLFCKNCLYNVRKKLRFFSNLFLRHCMDFLKLSIIPVAGPRDIL